MPSHPQLSLMIVEDDANIRYLLQAAAVRSGVYDPVVAAPDGEAALEKLRGRDRSSLPDMIVTDLSMPRLTGLELLRALKSDATLTAIPVAVITSSDIPNDRQLALAAGACAFLPKPHGLDAMIQTLVSLRDSCVGRRQTAMTTH